MFKFKFRQASNRCRKVLKSANLLMLIGQEKYYLPETWFSPPLANLKQGSQQRQGLKIQNWAPPLLNGPKFFFTSDESSLFTETFFENCNLDDSCSSLSISFAELNQPQVHNVKATLKMTSKITKTLHSTNTSSHYCILEMVLKICEPEQASAHEACDSTPMLAKENTALNFIVYSTSESTRFFLEAHKNKLPMVEN